MENEKKSGRIVYFDILNIISIIAVIAMHHNGIVHGNAMIRAWNTSLIVDCVGYFAVPVFCMISGATLMNYRLKYDTKTFFKKRFNKVLIPFIFWSGFMFLWKIFILKTIQIDGIVDLFNAFFKSREETTYYFIFIILGVYLMMPLLSCLTDDKYRKTLWYIVLVFFAINSTIVPLLKLVKIEWNMDLSILIGSYSFFAILGYLLSTQDIGKRNRILIYVGAIIGLIYRYVITFILSKASMEVNKLTWGYSSWNSVLYAVSIFLIFKELFKDSSRITQKISLILAKISSCTFGIYLIHKFVMYYEIEIFNVNEKTWVWRTFGIIPTYIISLCIVYIIKKVPILKRIVP